MSNISLLTTQHESGDLLISIKTPNGNVEVTYLKDSPVQYAYANYTQWRFSKYDTTLCDDFPGTAKFKKALADFTFAHEQASAWFNYFFLLTLVLTHNALQKKLDKKINKSSTLKSVLENSPNLAEPYNNNEIKIAQLAKILWHINVQLHEQNQPIE